IPSLWAIWQYKQFTKLSLVLGWCAAAYLLLVGGPQQNVRFGLTYMPPVAVLIGIGFDALWQHRQRFRFLYLLPVIFGIGLAWGGYNGYRWTDDFIQRKNIELET